MKSLKAISLINISLLKTTYADLWQRVVIHRFIADLGDGSLPIEKFRRYFFQDYVFVNDAIVAFPEGNNVDMAAQISYRRMLYDNPALDVTDTIIEYMNASFDGMAVR